MTTRISITTYTRHITDLEELCAVARRKGFTDEASVRLAHDRMEITVSQNADETEVQA